MRLADSGDFANATRDCRGSDPKIKPIERQRAGIFLDQSRLGIFFTQRDHQGERNKVVGTERNQ